MKLTKAEKGIKVGAANKRHIFKKKNDMRVDNFNKIYFYYAVFVGVKRLVSSGSMAANSG